MVEQTLVAVHCVPTALGALPSVPLRRRPACRESEARSVGRQQAITRLGTQMMGRIALEAFAIRRAWLTRQAPSAAGQAAAGLVDPVLGAADMDGAFGADRFWWLLGPLARPTALAGEPLGD